MSNPIVTFPDDPVFDRDDDVGYRSMLLLAAIFDALRAIHYELQNTRDEVASLSGDINKLRDHP